MPTPTVTEADAQLVIKAWLDANFASITGSSGYTYGTRVQPGVTPNKFMQFRLIGGTTEQATHTRPRVDFRLWGDSSVAGEPALLALAQKVLGGLRRDLRVRVFAIPTPLPDPVDQSKTHVLFTIELLTRGAQS